MIVTSLRDKNQDRPVVSGDMLSHSQIKNKKAQLTQGLRVTAPTSSEPEIYSGNAIARICSADPEWARTAKTLA